MIVYKAITPLCAPFPPEVLALVEYLERVTYKPNHSWRLHYNCDTKIVDLALVGRVVDSRPDPFPDDPHSQAPFIRIDGMTNVVHVQPPRQHAMVDVMAPYAFSVFVLDTLNTDWRRHIVEQVVRRFEQHEIDEWLRFDGVPFNDPHPKPPQQQVAP